MPVLSLFRIRIRLIVALVILPQLSIEILWLCDQASNQWMTWGLGFVALDGLWLALLLLFWHRQSRSLSSQFQKLVSHHSENLAQDMVSSYMLNYHRLVGLFESTSAYLHNVGNALTGMEVHVRGIERVVQSSEQWQDAIELIINSPESKRIELLNRLKQVQIQGAVPQLQLHSLQIRKDWDKLIDSVAQQQNLFKKNQNVEEMLREKINLEHLIHEVHQIHKNLLEYHEIQCELKLVSVEYLGHRFQLYFGLINLLRNAIESVSSLHHSGTGRILIEMENQAMQIKIRVCDNGLGFAAPAKENLFLQGHTTKAHGHGLGLHSFRQFLCAHHGSIDAFSPGDGMGAVFEVCLDHE